jgi:ubiquinone/menaquinone biosynthesis C-methylase UbiE
MPAVPPTNLTDAEIREYWTQQAREHGESPAASWSDRRAIDLEIQTLLPRIPEGGVVADLGCGNGWSTIHYADRASEIVGVDYVPELIASANSRLSELGHDQKHRMRFEVGDVRALTLPESSFDCVILTRVLINLPSDSDRRAALHGIARLIRPGGIALISEATLGGWARLNALREEWGLEAIPIPTFNRYIDESSLASEAAPLLLLEETVDFASTYFVLTRLIKPLLARVPGVAIDPADPQSEFNRFAAMLPAGGDYGTQKLFVLRRTTV